jgi:H+/Cl- antiporter ClcA
MNTTHHRHHLRRQQEERSLDLVQRMVISALIFVVFGLFASVLALYLVLAGDQDLTRSSVIGLWVMTALLGLATAAAILIVNRRPPYSPWVLLGLIPTAISGYWIFT